MPSRTEQLAPLDRRVQQQIRLEQVRLLLQQLPLIVTGTLLVATLIVSLSWQEVPRQVLLGWLGLVTCIALGGLWLHVRYAHREIAAQDLGGHVLRLQLGSALAGAICGVAPLLINPAHSFDNLTLILTLLGGLAAAGISTLGGLYSAYVSFLFALMMPLTVRLFFIAHPAALSVGLVSSVFVVLLAVAAHNLRAKLEQALALRFQNSTLNAYLTKHADDLQHEMEQRRSAEQSLATYAERLKRANHALQREVEERSRNEEALTKQALTIMESELRLRAILHNTFDGILTFDAAGHVQTMNPAAERLFGLRTDPRHRLCVADLIPALDPEQVSWGVVCELRGRHAGSGEFPLSLSLERMEVGVDTLYVCVVRDDTDAQRARRALIESRDIAEAANRAKSDFLSSMSHELRTPMNAILGFSQILQTDGDHPLSPEQKESVDQIAKGGWHLLQLINDVLDLAKVESGKVDAILEDVALDEVVEECINLVAPLAGKHSIELVDRAGGSGLHVKADYTRLKQVMLNLLSNGIKYNRQNGSVALEVSSTDDGWCEIGVVDTGVGLTAEQIAQIFEPFTRVSERRDEIEGTGIGLTITRRLMTLMGGHVGVESEPGSGSRFWLRIPLSVPLHAVSGGVTGEAVRPAARAAGPTRTVLYVEDNPANMALVEYLMRRKRPQIRLLSAHTGELGLTLAEAERPDLIMLDISLPNMDGYEVLGLLRSNPETRDIPVFALSANAMQRDIEQGLAAGFDDYLTKPIDVPRLLRTVDEMLERRAAA